MAAPAPIKASNPLAQPGQALSGNSLIQAAQALASSQTAGPLAELAKQIASNNAATQAQINRVGGYYNQLGQQTQSGVNQTNQIASGLNSQLQGVGSDTQNALGQIGRDAAASLLRYAPQASPGDASLASPALQSLTAELAKQQGLAAQESGAMRAFGANQGANYANLAASNLGTFGLRGQEGLKGIAQAGTIKNQPLTQKVADLQAQQGANFGTALGKLRQQEVSNQMARAGLGIKQQSNAITAQNDTARNALTIRGQNITAQNNSANQGLRLQQINASLRGQDLSHADRQAALAERQAIQNVKTGAGASKPLTPYQNNAMLTQLGQIQTLIQNGQGHKLSEQQIRANLSDGANPAKRPFNPALIEAAYELLGYGSINRSTAEAMHNMGIRGGTFRGKPITVTKNYQKPTGPGSNVLNAVGNLF